MLKLSFDTFLSPFGKQNILYIELNHYHYNKKKVEKKGDWMTIELLPNQQMLNLQSL
tara:strand:- start:55 stop:225 length:171 start_codon:yes stop_codon:yes gene_type:complete